MAMTLNNAHMSDKVQQYSGIIIFRHNGNYTVSLNRPKETLQKIANDEGSLTEGNTETINRSLRKKLKAVYLITHTPLKECSLGSANYWDSIIVDKEKNAQSSNISGTAILAWYDLQKFNTTTKKWNTTGSCGDMRVGARGTATHTITSKWFNDATLPNTKYYFYVLNHNGVSETTLTEITKKLRKVFYAVANGTDQGKYCEMPNDGNYFYYDVGWSSGSHGVDINSSFTISEKTHTAAKIGSVQPTTGIQIYACCKRDYDKPQYDKKENVNQTTKTSNTDTGVGADAATGASASADTDNTSKITIEKPNGIPPASYTAIVEFISDFSNYEAHFYACKDSTTLNPSKTFEENSDDASTSALYKNKIIDEDDTINSNTGQQLILCVEKDDIDNGIVDSASVNKSGIVEPSGIVQLEFNTNSDETELFSTLDQLQTGQGGYNPFIHTMTSSSSNAEGSHFYQNSGVGTHKGANGEDKGGTYYAFAEKNQKKNFAVLGPFVQSTSLMLETPDWINHRTCQMFAVIIDRALADNIKRGTEIRDVDSITGDNKYTWKRTIDPNTGDIYDGFADILYNFSSLGRHKGEDNFKPKVLTWMEYNNLTIDEKKNYIIKYFDVVIDPNKAVFATEDGSAVELITNEHAVVDTYNDEDMSSFPYIWVPTKDTSGNISYQAAFTYDIVENTNKSFQSYLAANKNVIKTLFRKEFTVTFELNDHKNTMKIVAVKLLEAYTRGRDFIEEPYVEVRADEQKPKDETSIITMQRIANRWMSYDDNYFTYKYSGRDFNLRKADGTRYLLSQDIKDEFNNSIFDKSTVLQPIECALVHSKDLLLQTDVTLGNTYECQKYYIQALKYTDADDGDLIHYKDTFKITDYEEAANSEQYQEGKTITSYLDKNKKKNNKYILDDLDVITSYIDLTRCPYYDAIQATKENNWCDCCYADNGKGTYNKECYYEKYGKCPYRFITEKHPRRIRTLKQDKSNRFNLIEELCKEFEFYPQFYIEYDDQGKVLTYKAKDKEVIEGKHKERQMRKHVYFMKERGQEKYAGFRYEKNLSSITRTVDSNSLTTKLYVEDNDSDLMPKGVCSIQLAQDNIPKTSYILNFDYYIMKNLLNKTRVHQDLWGIDEKDRAFMSRLGKLNTKYDSYSDLITTLTSKEMVDLLAEIKVAVEGIGTALEERSTTSQTMYQYKHETKVIQSKYNYTASSVDATNDGTGGSTGNASDKYWQKNGMFYNTVGQKKASTQVSSDITTSDTYKSYLLKYREIATTLWGLVEQLFYSGDYFALPIKVDGIDNNVYSFITYSYSNKTFNEAQDKRLQDQYLDSKKDDYLYNHYYTDDKEKGKLPWSDLKLVIGRQADALNKPQIRYADIIEAAKDKYCKGELFWRLVIEGFDFTNDTEIINNLMDFNVSADNVMDATEYKTAVMSHIPFISWDDFKTKIVQNLLYSPTGQLGQYRSLYNQVKYWKIERAKILDQINEISEEFYKIYEPYIKEGTYSDSNFLDNNKYYWAAVDVLNNSCKPEVSYSIDVVDISPIKEYTDDYTFEIGDITYVEDIDFFDINQTTGLPNRQKVLLSEITYNLDDPTKNSITVQNYTSSFDDLFEQITATVQSLTYNENTYKRASNITSQQYISSASLQGALTEGGLTLLDAHDGNIITTDDGTEGSGINNTDVKYKLNGQGLFFSKDGGESWDIGVGPEGINADYIKIGQLDASKIQIVDGNYIYFLWDKNGINAYRNPAKSTDGLKDFARFNKYGLSLIEKGNVRLRAGYDFRTKERSHSLGDAYNESGDYTDEDELTNQNVGFFLYNDQGKSIFRTETASSFSDRENSSAYTARLSLDGELFVTNTVLPSENYGSVVSAAQGHRLIGAYNIAQQPVDILTPISGTQEELSQKFTQQTQVTSRRSNNPYYLLNDKMYKYINKESLSTEDGAQYCVHIISGTNAGYYYFRTTEKNVNYGYNTNETALITDNYTPIDVEYYEVSALDGNEGSTDGVSPQTKKLYNVSASGTEPQSIYNYWEQMSNDVVIGQNGRTDGGYTKTEQIGIFVNNKIPASTEDKNDDDEITWDDKKNDSNTNETPDNKDTQDTQNNDDDNSDDTKLGADGDKYNPKTAADFIIVGDSLCQGLRANGGDYKDKFTGQGAAFISKFTSTNPLIAYDDKSKGGIVDLTNYNHIGFMFGTNGGGPNSTDLSNDHYIKGITEIFSKRGRRGKKTYIYIITPPCAEYTEKCKKETMMDGVNPQTIAQGLKDAGFDVECGATSIVDIWEGSKQYGYDETNNTIDGVHNGTTSSTITPKFASYILDTVAAACGVDSSSQATTNAQSIQGGTTAEGLDQDKVNRAIREAQKGAQRELSIVCKVQDSEKGEIIRNVFTILKTGVLYMGGEVKQKYGADLDISDLSYLPDEIKIDDPKLVLTTDGVIWCNWEKFFRIVDNNGKTYFDNTGRSLMWYLENATVSTGSSTATTATTGGTVTGYYLIDPLSKS